MRRNDIDICVDLLQVARAGVNKTQLVYEANLNFTIVKRYIERLRGNGLLVSEKGYYITTEKGSKFIDQYHELVGLHRSHAEVSL